jgi:hypothetical protein
MDSSIFQSWTIFNGLGKLWVYIDLTDWFLIPAIEVDIEEKAIVFHFLNLKFGYYRD